MPARFDGLKPPRVNHPLSEMEVGGVRIDLHQQMKLVGFTYGIEPTTATLGWAAISETLLIRDGQALPISGMALHFSELSRFESAFQTDPPGALEYYELRRASKAAPELEIVFHFEGGTLRIACGLCRGELVIATDDDEEESGTNLVQ
jgi:hypothetical protein